MIKFYKWYSITKNKIFEIQFSKWINSHKHNFEFNVKKKTQDHPGIELSITLFYYELRFDFYDIRHKEDFIKRK